jgi:hypothetical protein
LERTGCQRVRASRDAPAFAHSFSRVFQVRTKKSQIGSFAASEVCMLSVGGNKKALSAIRTRSLGGFGCSESGPSVYKTDALTAELTGR